MVCGPTASECRCWHDTTAAGRDRSWKSLSQSNVPLCVVHSLRLIIPQHFKKPVFVLKISAIYAWSFPHMLRRQLKPPCPPLRAIWPTGHHGYKWPFFSSRCTQAAKLFGHLQKATPHKEPVVTGVEFIWPLPAELIQIKVCLHAHVCGCQKNGLWQKRAKPFAWDLGWERRGAELGGQRSQQRWEREIIVYCDFLCPW